MHCIRTLQLEICKTFETTMIEQHTLEKKNYEERLEDPRWKMIREKILQRDAHQCKCCGSTQNLQVHHRQYHRYKSTGEWLKPWEYHPFFLMTVCAVCHLEGHKLFSIPTKEI